MSDLKKTIQELKEVIKNLKTQADKGTAWDTTEKANIEKRIEHLNDKSQPHHSNLTNPLKFDTQDLDNLEALIGQDKTAWALEKTKLEKEKKDAETERDAKNAIIADKEKELKEQKEQIADKLTTDLINGLDKLGKVGLKRPKKDKDGNEVKDSNGNIVYEELIDTQEIKDIKEIVDEIKTKGAKADLTDLTTKLEALSNKAEEIKTQTGTSSESKGTNYWSIGACITSGIAVLLLSYIAFFKPNGNSTRYKIDKEED